MSEKQSLPKIVISIDFEMRWGVHDLYGLNIDKYRTNIENVQNVVPRMLQMFSERNIRATWATVGALGLNSWDEYFAIAPPPPVYHFNNFKINPRYSDMDPNGVLHFAPNLVQKIVDTTGQELGSHSFSHIYFREKGVTVEDFIADAAAVSSLWKNRYNTRPVSIVFPRNQSAFVSRLSECGIHIWRANENAWYYELTTKQKGQSVARILRLYESINPWVKRASQTIKGVCRSSLFIRFNLCETLWELHVKRLENELNNLLHDDVLHIWWHPHNLGNNMVNRMSRLDRILDLISDRCRTSSVLSKNMSDCIAT